MITINNDPFQEYQKDFAYCESIIKKNSKSFYLAFSQLPKRKAQSVYAVYAFCRRADDLIDRDNNQAGLRQLERQILMRERFPTIQSGVRYQWSLTISPW